MAPGVAVLASRLYEVGCLNRGRRPGGGLAGRERAARRDRPQGWPERRGISGATPWWKARAVHGPGKILLDVALALAPGGDCRVDVGMPRAEPAVSGAVTSGTSRTWGELRLVILIVNPSASPIQPDPACLPLTGPPPQPPIK